MSRFQLFTIGSLILLAVGLVTLGVYLFNVTKTLDRLQKTNTAAISQTDSFFTPDFSEQLTTQEASYSALLTRVENLENAQTQKPTKTAVSSTTTAFQKQVIYLGAASSTSREWINSGLEVILDSADYPANVVATFEAGLSIVGGEAWARLANKTTGAIISASEVSHGSNTVTWKSSVAFKLHPGKNTYVVQIKSTSGEVANLAGARLVINQ